jgi:hypothetical protein
MKKNIIAFLEWFKDRLTIILIIILIMLLPKLCSYKQEIEDNKNLHISLKQELKTWKDEDGKNRAKIQTLVADNVAAFTMLETSDSIVTHLQSVVKKFKSQLKNQGSVTVIKTKGKAENTFSTTLVVKDTTECNPVFRTFYNFDNWVYGEIVASKDSTGISVTYKEELDVVIGEEKTGFLGLGKSKRFVDVTLHNPYSEVEKLRVFEKMPPRSKKFTVGPGVYYGFNSNLNSGLYLGVGIQYSMFKF